VLARILALDEAQVRASLDDVVIRFNERQRDLADTCCLHARELADRLDPGRELSEARKLGATLTYAVEFSDDITLCERVLWPSMWAEQAGMDDARLVRFVEDDDSVIFYVTYTPYSGMRSARTCFTSAQSP
jgi:hypothetical protein